MMLNKTLLAAIALGLWANAASTFVRPARADGCDCANELYDLNLTLSSHPSSVESAIVNLETTLRK
jgi:hypothetical protein